MELNKTPPLVRDVLFADEKDNIREEVESVLVNADWWLYTPNTFFEGRTPDDLIGTSEEYRVRDVIRAIKHGMTS